jgi:hypothetical protein
VKSRTSRALSRLRVQLETDHVVDLALPGAPPEEPTNHRTQVESVKSNE